MFFLLQSSQRSDATKTDRWTTKTLVKWLRRLGFLALDWNSSRTLKENMEIKYICFLSLMPEERLILTFVGRKLLKDFGCPKRTLNISGPEQRTMKLHLLSEDDKTYFLKIILKYFFYLMNLLFCLNKFFFMITHLAFATQNDCKSEWCIEDLTKAGKHTKGRRVPCIQTRLSFNFTV